MRRLATAVATAAMTCSAIAMAPAALAQSDVSRALQSAYVATMAELAAAGGTVGVEEGASRDRILFGEPIPAGDSVRFIYQGRPSGEYSVEVTQQGAPLAAWGNNAADGRWSTLGAAGTWNREFMRGTTLTTSTIVKGMDRRLDMDAADDASRQIIADLALPPGTSKGGRTWTSMRMRQSGALSVITAKARSKSCSYGAISITLKAGRIVESSWTSTCKGAGRATHASSWTGAVGAAGAGPTAITQAQAMELSANPVEWKDWLTITRAANLTAATTWSDITRVLDSQRNSVEHQVPVIDALRLLDVLIRNGASGIVWSSASDGSTNLAVGASGSNGYFLNVDGVAYSGGSISIGPDGRLTRFHLTYLDGSDADGETITFVR